MYGKKKNNELQSALQACSSQILLALGKSKVGELAWALILWASTSFEP